MKAPGLLLPQGSSDPGQVVGDVGVDTRWVVVPEGNNALCHLIAHQGPTGISLGTERLDLEACSPQTRFHLVPWGSALGLRMDRGVRAPRELIHVGATRQALVTAPGNLLSLRQQPPLPQDPPAPWPSVRPLVPGWRPGARGSCRHKPCRC